MKVLIKQVKFFLLTVSSSSKQIGQHIFLEGTFPAGSSLFDVEASIPLVFSSFASLLSATSNISSSVSDKVLPSTPECEKRQDGSSIAGSPRYILFTHWGEIDLNHISRDLKFCLSFIIILKMSGFSLHTQWRTK